MFTAAQSIIVRKLETTQMSSTGEEINRVTVTQWNIAH